jgi:HEAT repeat protein
VNVVPFRRRPAAKWLAQAAAVVIVAGGSYFAGHRTLAPRALPPLRGPEVTSIQPASYSIAETRTLAAKSISPNIEGRPNIENVRFVDADPSDGEIGVGFDITSHITVTGAPTDKSMVRLLSYVLQSEDRVSPSRSRAIDWVRDTYSKSGNADPEITSALAKVLRNEQHEGVRIKATDALNSLAPRTPVTAEATRDALIEALKSDPNPAVRLKAVEALARIASSGQQLDPQAIDTLRLKASQDDENLYVRVKAAEALSSLSKIRPQ